MMPNPGFVLGAGKLYKLGMQFKINGQILY
jgi:hypothetical protein